MTKNELTDKYIDTAETVRQIKRSFRLYMNGVASSSMRQKGVNYKVNWGISQVELRRMAQRYAKDTVLAAALWKENVRECKLLATMLMPVSGITVVEAIELALDSPTVEVSEALAFNLFQHMPEASALTEALLGSEKTGARFCGYNLVCRLLKNGVSLSDALYTLLLKRSEDDIKYADRQMLHAIVNCLGYISVSDNAYAKKTDNILNAAGFGTF